MSETIYTVEYAKSGRSKCKKCKEPIEKGQIRIHAESESNSGMHMSNSYHPVCFTKPRKYPDLQDFMENVLVDASGGEILPQEQESLMEAIASKPAKKKDDSDSPLAEIKKLVAEQENDQDNPPTNKKQKNIQVEIYKKYQKYTAPQLKDLLRWNRQVLKGTKDMVFFKVIDGETHGRLARCGMCGGKLKIDDDAKKVVCSGGFDEVARVRLTCPFTCELNEAPRWEWFTEEPTEEQEAEMDKQEAIAKGEDVETADTDDKMQKLLDDAAKIDWDLSGRDAIRKSCQALTDLLIANGLDNPTVKSVGNIISANRSLKPQEIAELCVKQFGYAEQKAAKAAKKQEALATTIKNPDNTALVAAFQELMTLYGKEGNHNAAGTYSKVVAALSDLEYKVTGENALGLGKGKTKVAGIGKGSAEKIHEYVTTGKIEKLEEKRLEAEE